MEAVRGSWMSRLIDQRELGAAQVGGGWGSRRVKQEKVDSPRKTPNPPAANHRRGSKAGPLGPYEMIYSQYIYKAKKKGRGFNLSKRLFLQLILSPCTYCGAPPSPTATGRGYHLITNGIDRKNQSDSYTAGSVLTACTRCNFAKGSMDYEPFMAWVSRVYEHNLTNLNGRLSSAMGDGDSPRSQMASKPHKGSRGGAKAKPSHLGHPPQVPFKGAK